MSQSMNASNAPSSNENLPALAEEVLENTKAVSQYLQATHFTPLSFDSTSTERLESAEYVGLAGKLMQTLEKLQYLVEGPRKHFRALCCQGYELAAFQVALDFGYFNIVPAEGQISLVDLAEQAGMDLDRTSRIVRILATESVFREPVPGYIAHTPSSYLLHSDKEIRATLHYTVDEMLKAASITSDIVKQSPTKYDSTSTPFSKRHGFPIYEFYGTDPQRSLRFAKAMAGWSKIDSEPKFRRVARLQSFFPWGDLKGTVVNVGGGSGKVSITLAQSNPALDFIVQDAADMHTAGQKLLTTEDPRKRVTYMQHDIFTPQPVGGSSVAAFLMRNIALNRCDADVERQFRALVPALERCSPTTPLLINEIIMPPEVKVGTALARGRECGLRQIDLIMLVCFGGKLRTPSEMELLLKRVDPRFEVHAARFEGMMGLLEVYLRH